MNTLFAETLKKLRTERGLSQVELEKRVFVNSFQAGGVNN
jgi:hypothetical protein